MGCCRKFCGVMLLVILIIVIASVVLYFTVFKIRDPLIIATPFGDPEIIIGSGGLRVILNLIITVDNRNYGSFKFNDSTASVDYHGDNIGELPLQGGFVPARGKHDITTAAKVWGAKLLQNAHFWPDFTAGSLNMTSTATLPGKVNIVKIIKIKAKAIATCDITVFIGPNRVVTNCRAKLKF